MKLRKEETGNKFKSSCVQTFQNFQGLVRSLWIGRKSSFKVSDYIEHSKMPTNIHA